MTAWERVHDHNHYIYLQEKATKVSYPVYVVYTVVVIGWLFYCALYVGCSFFPFNWWEKDLLLNDFITKLSMLISKRVCACRMSIRNCCVSRYHNLSFILTWKFYWFEIWVIGEGSTQSSLVHSLSVWYHLIPPRGGCVWPLPHPEWVLALGYQHRFINHLFTRKGHTTKTRILLAKTFQLRTWAVLYSSYYLAWTYKLFKDFLCPNQGKNTLKVKKQKTLCSLIISSCKESPTIAASHQYKTAAKSQS